MVAWSMAAAVKPTQRPVRRVAVPATVEVVPPPPRPVRAFSRWVAESTHRGAAVLNVGGGCNRSGTHPGIRSRAGTLVTVDPSPAVWSDEIADERHQATLEEFAADHAGRFDVAFAVYVLEHVAEPVAFSEAAARVLRPGGTFFALTLNRWHYFGLSTRAASRLGVEQWLLERVRDPDVVHEYHVPTAYRMNGIRQVSRLLGDAGFSAVQVRMFDATRLYEPYLPGPLSRLAGAWSRAAYAVDRPGLMGHLTLRAVR